MFSYNGFASFGSLKSQLDYSSSIHIEAIYRFLTCFQQINTKNNERNETSNPTANNRHIDEEKTTCECTKTKSSWGTPQGLCK